MRHAQTLGVTPLAGATRDVLGPLTKTVEDAALALDVMTGYGTPEFVGVAPPGGYTGYFGKMTLKGKRIGLCAYLSSWVVSAPALPQCLSPTRPLGVSGAGR